MVASAAHEGDGGKDAESSAAFDVLLPSDPPVGGMGGERDGHGDDQAREERERRVAHQVRGHRDAWGPRVVEHVEVIPL